jgi:hypothetical protein
MDQAVSGVNKFWMMATSLPALLPEWRIQLSMALSDMTVTQFVDPRQPNEAVPAHCGATKTRTRSIT